MENKELEIIETENSTESQKLPKVKNPERTKNYIRLFFMSFAVTVLLGFIVGMVMYITGGSIGATAEKYYERGMVAIEAKEYDVAVENFTKALEKDSYHVGSRVGLCAAYEGLEKYEEEYNVAVEGIELSPATYEYYSAAVKALCYQGKMAEARQFLSNCTNNYVLLKMENSRPDKITFSTQPGTYGEKIDLSLTSSPNAVIYYTTDGSEPNLNSQVYNGAISVTEKLTIRAFAISEGGILSDEVEGAFRVRDENAVYTFIDEAVESVVRAEIGNYGELTYKDLDDLTEFSSENSSGKIASLEDFKEFLNLTKVEFYGDTIGDFSPLNEVRGLKTIIINRVNLTEDNLSQIAKCAGVTTLDLSECGLTTVAPLAPMTSITTLTLNNNALGGSDGSAPSFGALKDIKMTKLTVHNNGLKSVGGIGEIVSLKTLDISENNITSLDDIGKLSKLDSLIAKDNAIESASGLSFLTSLKTLNLSGNALTDISDLANAKSVSSMDLSGNEIADFSPLQGTNIASLTAQECGISDITGICDIITLRSLDLSKNGISDLSPIANLPYISELKVANNNINTIIPLKGITSLTSLDISGNDVKKDEAQLFNSLKINWG